MEVVCVWSRGSSFNKRSTSLNQLVCYFVLAYSAITRSMPLRISTGGVAHTSVLRVGIFFLAALLFFITRLNRSRPSGLLPLRKRTNCSTANPLGDAPAFWSPGLHAYTRASRELSLCSRR